MANVTGAAAAVVEQHRNQLHGPAFLEAACPLPAMMRAQVSNARVAAPTHRPGIKPTDDGGGGRLYPDVCRRRRAARHTAT